VKRGPIQLLDITLYARTRAPRFESNPAKDKAPERLAGLSSQLRPSRVVILEVSNSLTEEIDLLVYA
jgi:hypothetical protein